MRRLAVVTALVTAFTLPACTNGAATTPQLQAILSGEAAPRGIGAKLWAETKSFYSRREHRLAWVETDGPTARTSAALDVLRSADSHGLNPADYGETAFREQLAGLAADDDSTEAAVRLAEFDVRVTATLLELARDVAIGRHTPAVIDSRWNTRRKPRDHAALLQAATDENVAAFLDSVQPVHPEYRALRDALAKLNARAVSGWPRVPPATLKVGQWHNAVVPLRQRLVAAGYLPEHAALDSAHFDREVSQGVGVFQEQHGLPPTGVLDRVTLERMNVPLDARRSQMALNLERWRWLPDDLGARHFLVNVPAFDIVAREDGRRVLDMRVVVGKRGNETPLFSDEMETVVFSPYWNVPETIALQETAPAVASDPDFLARNNMEVVNAEGDVVPADEIPWDDEQVLQAYRFRQRPGEGNALGFVKFLFPNEHAVYLHDTPAVTLFKRIGRAFSHGCVRVEEPHALARYVLRDQPQWSDEAIHAAMRAGDERHVKLRAPIPVHIVYFTAWVDERGGLRFAEDVYGYDGRQRKAAARPRFTK